MSLLTYKLKKCITLLHSFQFHAVELYSVFPLSSSIQTSLADELTEENLNLNFHSDVFMQQVTDTLVLALHSTSI